MYPYSASASPDERDLVRLLTPEGRRVDHPDAVWDGTIDDLLALHRDMVLTRRIDAEGFALQRHGELGLWPPSLGQEAAQVGTARALRPQDMAFPTYRQHGVSWVCGLPPEKLLGLYRGTDLGGWDPADYGLALPAIIIGAQTLHAAGYAMGVVMDGAVGHDGAGSDGAESEEADRDTAVAVWLGDGATSQGDSLEAMSWAATFSLPLVFVIENNQYAISSPTRTQSAVPLVRRAAGFGLPGVRVDGNDVLACQAVMTRALQRARAGHGPTVIEAVTYRRGAHTTSDDPTRYRGDTESEYWEARDPIARLRAAIENEAAPDLDIAAAFAALDVEAEALGERLRAACSALPDPDLAAMFDLVHVETPTDLTRQQGELVALRAVAGQEAAS